MVDRAVAMRVDLRYSAHAIGAQVVPCFADGFGSHGVVPRAQDGVRHDHGGRDEHSLVLRGVGVAALVDLEAIEIRDPLDAGGMLGEEIEHRLPQCLGDANRRAHAASAWVEGPA